jgi:hypothetical protein
MLGTFATALIFAYRHVFGGCGADIPIDAEPESLLYFFIDVTEHLFLIRNEEDNFFCKTF